LEYVLRDFAGFLFWSLFSVASYSFVIAPEVVWYHWPGAIHDILILSVGLQDVALGWLQRKGDYFFNDVGLPSDEV
jgi:hypothetical protein